MKVLKLLDAIYDFLADFFAVLMEQACRLPFLILMYAGTAMLIKTARILFHWTGILGLVFWVGMWWLGWFSVSKVLSPEISALWQWIYGVIAVADFLMLIGIALSDD